MAIAGMDIVRMNFSHGGYDFHGETIRLTRRISERLRRHIGILMDLQGPKIRTGKLKKESVVLHTGDTVTLTTDELEGDWEVLSVSYKRLPQEAKKGERIFLDDGNIELKVIGVDEKSVECRIVNGGTVRPLRGLNLPDTNISSPSLTEKDLEDLAFGIDRGVDFAALSFVRKPEDVSELRFRIKEKGSRIPIIAKIEKPEAVRNLDRIIEESDGIMVARGDLGAETSPQDVPILQKTIIRKCNHAGKPVITATQMLESMINRVRPSRAEASDVANAIFDGTDAVMLSEETAIGNYPVQAVRMMSRIAAKAERELTKRWLAPEGYARRGRGRSIADSICYSATRMSEQLNPRLIVSFTLSGKTAFLMSMHRPHVPIIAMSPRVEVLRRLSLYWGVHPVLMDEVQSTEELISAAERILVEHKFCREEELVIIIGGVPVLEGAPTNMLKAHHVKLEGKNI
jgi:pyruvate kinase